MYKPDSELVSRRQLLTRGASLTVAGLAGSSLLAACGGSSKTAATTATTTASGGAQNFGTLKFDLPWLKDISGAGEWVADSKGYYRDAGFTKVVLIAGGPSAPPAETIVTQRKAMVGVSAPDLTAAAVLQGAPVVIIGAQQQRGPFCVMSLAKNPINTPQDMIGKKIGVQSSNIAIWRAFLRANNIDPAKVTAVPVQFDPTPLTTGQVDGWLANFNNEPIGLAAKGFPTKVFLFADHNYPLVGAVYVVRTDTLAQHRDAVSALMTAEIKGWRGAIDDPAGAAQLAVSKYGKSQGLDLKEQTKVMEATVPLMVSDYTKKNGLFLMSDELIKQNIDALALSKVKIEAAKLFDMSLLHDLYAKHPELI